MASYEETLVNISLDAHADLAVHTNPPHAEGVNASGVQYRFVQVSGPHECNLFTNESGQIAVGVLQSKPQHEGQACTVAVSGISMVEVGGEIAAGEAVGADGDGRAVAGGDLGVAIYGAPDPEDDSGVLIPVLLRLTTAAVPA